MNFETRNGLGALSRRIAALLLVTLFATQAVNAQVPPANDDFVNSILLVGDGTWTGSNVNATSEPGEPQHASVPTGSSIWFHWVAPTDGFFTVDTIGSNYDTVLGLYTGTAVDALTFVAANDDTFGTLSRLGDVPVIGGAEYRLAVDGYSANQGSVQLNFSFFDGVDVTPPVIDIFSPPEGAVYVQNGIVMADYTCTDEALGSGVASCAGDAASGSNVPTGVSGAQVFSVTATDNAGNTATVSVNYTVSGTDVTPPVVDLDSPADGAFYVQGATLVASYTCSDELFGTGLASCSGDLPSGAAIDTTLPGAYSFQVTGTDNAGNTTTVSASYQIVDSLPNDHFADAHALAQDDTWLGTNVTATAEPGEPVHANVGGGQSVWFQWTAPQDGYVTFDTFGSDFDTVLALYTGSAVDQLTFVAANDDALGRQSELPDVPVIAGTVYRAAVDGYFAATGGITLNVSFFDGTDTTPPQITVYSPQADDVFVHNAIVPASYLCEDEALGTGVASCVGDVAVGEPIATAALGASTFTVTATDLAGNVGTLSVPYTVSGTDTTPPVVSVFTPADGAVFSVGGAITASYSCSDEFLGTGIASCTGTLADGAPLDTSATGTFTFTATGIDNAGNVTDRTVTYTIVESPANDNFADAVTIADPGGSWSGTNVGATVESGEPSHVILPSNASIWFQYTPAQSGYVTVDTFGSNFDTALAMYTGSSVGGLSFVAANNNASGQQSELLNVAVTGGTTYHIAVDGYFGDTGLVTLSWAYVQQYDFTPPVINLWSPQEGQIIPQDDPVWAGYSCYDPIPGTGLVTCQGPVNPNIQLDTSVPGDFVFTVTATDGAGNESSETRNYTIVANPPNDDFVDAIVLAEQGSTGGSNLGSTSENSEPMHASTLAQTSVWYRWTAPADGFLSADTLGSDFDTVLAVYTGTVVNALTMVDANDDAVGTTSAIHNAPVNAGVTYSIAVAGAWDDTGNYTLSWSFAPLNDVTAPTIDIGWPEDGGLYFEGVSLQAAYSCVDEPLGSGIASCIGNVEHLTPFDTATAGAKTFTVTATDNSGNTATASANYSVLALSNDHFANALDIAGSGHVVAINTGATVEIGEPDHAGAVGGASIWFRWTAAEDGFLSVDTLLTDFDTTLAVYTGASVDALTEVASNNDTIGQGSRIRDIPVITGQVLYIAVDGVGGATGQVDVNWVTFTGPTFTEISPLADPLWVTDADHDFWLNAAAPADVDGDGDLDLAAIGYYVTYNVGAEDRLVVFMNDGPGADGNWVFTTQEVPMGGLTTNQSDLAWGDFDGDGDPDLAVGGQGATGLFRNDDGVLAPIAVDLPAYSEDSNYTLSYDLRSLSWADYDNDADLDLLIPSIYDDATFSYRTVLMRNDGPDGAGGWIFTEVPSQIDATVHAQTAWADQDGDGDLDLFMTNIDNLGTNGFIRTYRNDNGVFSSAEPLGNLDMNYGMADWADYDLDGDLDILIVGQVRDLDGQNKTLLRIYDNVNGVHQPNTIVQSSFWPWLDLGAATWADYDSDGDMDILLTGSRIGEENIEGRSEVYVNDNGQFVPLGRELPAPMDSANGGAFTWFDVDGDGDLDYFVAGAYWVPGGNNLIETQMHLYRNDSIVLNAQPSPPTGLSTTAARSGDSGTVTLSWDAAIDDTTTVAALTYELQIRPQGSSGGAFDQFRHGPQPGNVSTATAWTLQGLAPGAYEWSVRAIDSAFNGSVAAQSTFVVGGGVDSDGDGVVDAQDNCTAAANADQRDTDSDGFGNLCDPDFNNDGVVNAVDLGILRSVFFTTDANADLNGDGVVNVVDLAITRAHFFGAPGPSGVAGGR